MNATHREIHTRLYRIWRNMKTRCQNSKAEEFKNYGGRGITLCSAWQRYELFRGWAKSNGYQDNLEIDRIDNNSGYSPENCRWATRKQNCRNTRFNHFLTAFSETKSVMEWSEDPRCRVNLFTLYARISHDWPTETAITKPGRKYSK